MNNPIVVTADQVKRQAQMAAGRFTDINDACPYPFGTEAAEVFKAEFLWIRRIIETKAVEGAHL